MQLFQPLSNQEPVAMQTTLHQPLMPTDSWPDSLAQAAAISVSACYQRKKEAANEHQDKKEGLAKMLTPYYSLCPRPDSNGRHTD
jgi:hypothetical protein